LKNDHESNNQTNNQLRLRVRELESNISSYESVANKSSLTITSLQKDAKEKQEQLIELQSRLRLISNKEKFIFIFLLPFKNTYGRT
jgi:hypothetical protein